MADTSDNGRLSVRELEFAAGFLLGEGCFSRSRKTCPRIDAAQAELWPLEKMKRLFGGALRPWTSKSVVAKGGKPMYYWQLAGHAATGLMMTLYPLLSPKRRAEIRAVLADWRAGPVANYLKPACAQGHPFIPENTHRHFSRAGGKPYMRRQCLACRRASRLKERARERQRRLAEILLVAV